ncbi:MAG: hypothetical protein QM405_03760 [Euryarchaeota archaeon]|nr:hypothetical protein [Euryarchaeota archaeon]HNS24556.1 hypothetical protein [Methanobacteriaceae archaeon]
MNCKIIYTNSLFIALLSAIAALSGLFRKGLYSQETISMGAQAMGQDLATLLLAIPLLLLSLYLVGQKSLKGQMIWMGSVFYFLYTYASLSFLATYNQLFLVYVAIFSLSLYTFIYGLLSLDASALKHSIKTGNATRVAAIFIIVMATMLAFMWLNMIIGSLLSGSAPAVLETYTTLVVQALDLGVLVPAAIIAGLLLLKRRSWGYVLTSILIVKISLLGTAILSMIYFMAQKGVEVVIGQVLFFVLATVGGIIIAVWFYNKIDSSVYVATTSPKMALGKGK